MTQHRFADREEAGSILARHVKALQLKDPIVLALPRGGVPVAAKIATALNAPLDVVLVRKIGVPEQPELAAAAVVDGGEPEVVLNEDVIALAGVTEEELERAAAAELREIERRRALYLKGRSPTPLEDRTLIVVDDGIATGASVRAALKALARKHPKGLVLAVPVAPQSTLDDLASLVDEIVCLETPDPFYAIGAHYRDFHQVPDEEVMRHLASAANSTRKS